MCLRIFCVFAAFISATLSVPAQTLDSFWPHQVAPKTIVTCKISDFNSLAELNLAQSVSGLAAKAVNEKTNDEGVWVDSKNEVYQTYYQSLVKRLHLKAKGTYDVWQLVKRFKDRNVIKGYVLYNAGRGDNSINLATVYAGITRGVMIDQSQEKQAIANGLNKLKDVTEAQLNTQAFLAVAPASSRNMLIVANPAFSNNRDYAIAHNSMVYYGVDSLFFKILDWVKPLSPVIGWNKGDEFKQIEPCTSRGLVNVPADWCQNLVMLTIGATEALPEVKTLSPSKIDWNNTKSCISFVMSDGDNMQWTVNQFLTSNEYWANAENGSIPMSFTSCVFNISLAAPDIYKQLASTQPDHVSVVEYGGGYYYPDLFGRLTGHGEELLRMHARRINKQLQHTGTRVFGFICKNVNSPEAMAAYRIFAGELDDITGMIAVQYSPYNGGKGQVFWAKNKQGVDIPIAAARYQLWANQQGAASGNPEKLAAIINHDHEGRQTLDWTIVHAWSMFKSPSEDVPDTLRKRVKGIRGVAPVAWTKQLLNAPIKAVNIEELLWRIRMAHDPALTARLIK